MTYEAAHALRGVAGACGLVALPRATRRAEGDYIVEVPVPKPGAVADWQERIAEQDAAMPLTESLAA